MLPIGCYNGRHISCTAPQCNRKCSSPPLRYMPCKLRRVAQPRLVLVHSEPCQTKISSVSWACLVSRHECWPDQPSMYATPCLMPVLGSVREVPHTPPLFFAGHKASRMHSPHSRGVCGRGRACARRTPIMRTTQSRGTHDSRSMHEVREGTGFLRDCYLKSEGDTCTILPALGRDAITSAAVLSKAERACWHLQTVRWLCP